MTTEEFFRDVVFGAENRRERRREQNTAPMTSPDYWRQEFDETQEKVAPHIEMTKQTSHRTTERPPRPGFPVDPAQPKAPGRLTTFPESHTILGSGLDRLSTVPQDRVRLTTPPTGAKPGLPSSLSLAQTATPQRAPQSPERGVRAGHAPEHSGSAAATPTGGHKQEDKDTELQKEALFEAYSPITPDPDSPWPQVNLKSPAWALHPDALVAKASLDAARHRDLDGSILDAGTLLGHYIYGDGSTREMDIRHLDTKDVSPETFPELQQKIDALKEAGGGRTHIALTLPYRTKLTQRAGLGNITLTLGGDLEVNEKGWTFDGGLGAGKDTYNFDPKDWGERSYLGEFSTRVGARLKGKPFDIEFKGTKPIRTGKQWK